MGWVWGLRKNWRWSQCSDTWLGVGSFSKLRTWEKRLGCLGGDIEVRLSSSVSSSI